MQKKRLWIFNHYSYTPEMGGLTRHFDFAKELITQGYEVTIFASSFHHYQYKETKDHHSFFLEEEVNGVNFVWLKTISYHSNGIRRFISWADYCWKAFRAQRKIKEEPDIILGSSIHLFGAYTAYRISKLKKVPFIVEIRDLWPETLIALGWHKKHPLVWFLGKIEKILYKNAKKIIVLLPLAHEYILNLGLEIKRDKIVCISNGINVDYFKNNIDDSLLPQAFLSFFQNNKLSVVYTGSIGRVHALDVMLEAAKIVQEVSRDIQFLLIGYGPLKEHFIEEAKRMNLTNLHFLDAVSKNAIPTILDKADILYSSAMQSELYKYGTSLNKVREYMIAGKPIVSVLKEPLSPITESECGIVVDDYNPQTIADSILHLANLPVEERTIIGDKGKRFAEQNYSFKYLSRKMHSVFEEALQQ